MYKRTIDYIDYDGNKRSEDCYFNINKAELLKWITTSGDYTIDKVLLKLYQERNGKRIMEEIDQLIKISYGEKSLDGRRFMKSEEIWKNFQETEAYSILFTELISDAQKAGEFVNHILPQELMEQVAKELKAHPEGIPAELKDYIPK